MAGPLNITEGAAHFLPGAAGNATTSQVPESEQQGDSATKRYLKFDDEMGGRSLVLHAPLQLPSSAVLDLPREMQLGAIWLRVEGHTSMP